MKNEKAIEFVKKHGLYSTLLVGSRTKPIYLEDFLDLYEQEQLNKPAVSKREDVERRILFDNFYAWLDGLTVEEYDKMSLTDKCETFFFKISK